MKRVIGLAVSLLLAFLAGPAVPIVHSQAQALVIGLPGEPGSLDVARPDGMQMLVDINAAVPMMRIADDASLIPVLAENWKAVNETTYEFRLRKGATFHSGKPITARDVKWNLDRLLAPETKAAWAYPIAMTDKIVVIDDYNLRITTKYPYAPYLSALSDWNGWLIEPEAVTRWGEQAGQHIVGSGPFVFKEWQRGDRIELQAYEKFFMGRPRVDRVVFRFIPDPAARVAALEAGDIDISYSVPPHEVQRLKSRGLTVLAGPVWRADYLNINTQAPPFNDVRVRQALNYAIDVDTIIETILGGMTVPLKSPQPRGTFGYAEFSMYRYDPAKARDLLRQAGYPNGFETELWVPAGRYIMAEQVVEALQSQLKKVGIDAKIRVIEWGQYQPQLRGGRCRGLAFLGLGVSGGDPVDFYATLKTGVGQNTAFYSNPMLDSLMDKAAGILTPQVRKELYRDIQRLVLEEAPWVFLYEEPQIIAMSSKIKGFVFRKMEWESFRLFRSQGDQVYKER